MGYPNQSDDPSQHDNPTESEMKEINLGPVMNADGSPSDITLEMFGLTREQWEAQQAERKAIESIDVSKITFPASTGWSEEKANRTPYVVQEMPPNYYIYPGLEWVIKGYLKDFLEMHSDVEFNYEDIDSNDSWSWTVEEARKLFQKLS